MQLATIYFKSGNQVSVRCKEVVVSCLDNVVARLEIGGQKPNLFWPDHIMMASVDLSQIECVTWRTIW